MALSPCEPVGSPAAGAWKAEVQFDAGSPEVAMGIDCSLLLVLSALVISCSDLEELEELSTVWMSGYSCSGGSKG